jgi:hypothetical protein
MARNKIVDQLLLLISAVVFICGMLWIINFMQGRSVPERMGFFILMNVIVGFILIWNGVLWFRRTPRFWIFQTLWVALHAAIAFAWASSGWWVELCVLVLPLECYLNFKIAQSLLRRASPHVG